MPAFGRWSPETRKGLTAQPKQEARKAKFEMDTTRISSAQVELARKFLALWRPTLATRFPITGLAVIIEDACGASVSHKAILAAARRMGLRADPVTETSSRRVSVHWGDVG